MAGALSVKRAGWRHDAQIECGYGLSVLRNSLASIPVSRLNSAENRLAQVYPTARPTCSMVRPGWRSSISARFMRRSWTYWVSVFPFALLKVSLNFVGIMQAIEARSEMRRPGGQKQRLDGGRVTEQARVAGEFDAIREMKGS